jgi:O-antigen/teichoic acid export membrane protein
MLALFVATTAVFSIIATLKLEHAIMLPTSDKQAAGIMMALLFTSLLFATIILVAIYFFSNAILALWNYQKFSGLVYFLPLSVFFISSYQGLRFLQLRHKNFKLVSLGSVVSVATGVLISLGVGYFWGENFASIGLIMGFVAQSMVNTWILLVGIKKLCQNFSGFNIRYIVSSITPYKKLITSLMISHSISEISARVPVFAIGSMFGITTVGFYNMAERIVVAPATLIANSIGDVYRQWISVAWQSNGHFNDIFLKTLRITTMLGSPIYALGIILSPIAFSYILGPEWLIAGEYTQIILVSGLFQFITAPMDKGAVVVGAIKFIFFWNLLRLILNITVVAAAIVIGMSIHNILWAFVFAKITSYTVNLYYEYRFSLGTDKLTSCKTE